MMRLASSSFLYYFLLFFLLINHIDIVFAKGCSKSCGKLSGIHYPFRLQGDPSGCGSPKYELVCEGDGEDAVAVLYYHQQKYYVTKFINDIYDDDDDDDYGYSYASYMTIHVECPFTTTSSTCHLQHNSSYNHHYVTNDIDEDYYDNRWASFISCSQPIENEVLGKYYMEVPSLRNKNSSVYAIINHYGLQNIMNLGQSCRFLDTFLFPYQSFEEVNSSRQVLEILHKGFNLTWKSDEMMNYNCWSYALWQANFDADWKAKFDKYWLISVPFKIYIVEVMFEYLYCAGAKAYCDHNENCEAIVWVISYLGSYVVGILLWISLLCRLVLAPLSICVFLFYNYKKSSNPIDDVEKFLRKHQVLSPRRYTYGEITMMTRNFKEKLGKGGFGHVYKGELPVGVFVAVKVLDGTKFNGEEFINEVATIGGIHHINVVQLVGFCSEGTRRAIVYEYMFNGSLDKYIFSSRNSDEYHLTSDRLNSIALGIARGINYLHSGCDMQILHFDIKPHNILLDHNFTPKISDFGLAKLYPKKQNLVSISAARGTIGYIAPELISRSFGIISYKSDVYSFGMLLLEMAGRRRNVDSNVQHSSEIYFPSWIYDQLTHQENRNIDEINKIKGLETKLCKIGLWCIQMNSSNRPTMGEVVEFLEAGVDVVQMPPKPFFSPIDEVAQVQSYISVELSDI